MKKKLLTCIGFFIGTPLLLLFTLSFFLYVSFQKDPEAALFSFFVPAKTTAFAALPAIQSIGEQIIESKDARVELVRQFFARYNSPLEPYANIVVESADLSGLDFRLIPAIAMQESNLCKKAPSESYNCWGFGIYGGKITRFGSYQEGIETVTRTLARQYKNKGLDTPEEIAKKYTPSDNGKWVHAVNLFMDQLQ